MPHERAKVDDRFRPFLPAGKGYELATQGPSGFGARHVCKRLRCALASARRSLAARKIALFTSSQALARIGRPLRPRSPSQRTTPRPLRRLAARDFRYNASEASGPSITRAFSSSDQRRRPTPRDHFDATPRLAFGVKRKIKPRQQAGLQIRPHGEVDSDGRFGRVRLRAPTLEMTMQALS